MKKLEVMLRDEQALPPVRGTPGSAGYDLFAYGRHTLSPGETKIIPTGLTMVIEEGYVGLLWDRSSLGAKGIHRFAGVIDSDYRKEVGVVLFNASNAQIEIAHQQKFAQILFQKIESPEILIVKSVSETKRVGGFGSTDLKQVATATVVSAPVTTTVKNHEIQN